MGCWTALALHQQPGPLPSTKYRQPVMADDTAAWSERSGAWAWRRSRQGASRTENFMAPSYRKQTSHPLTGPFYRVGAK